SGRRGDASGCRPRWNCVRVSGRRRGMGPRGRHPGRLSQRAEGTRGTGGRPGRRLRRRWPAATVRRSPGAGAGLTAGKGSTAGTAGADLVVFGRIATLAGDRGFGWADAIAVASGRVIAAGSRDDVEPAVRPGTRRLMIGPHLVVLP